MVFQSQLPLISCICITDSRVEMLIKSIISFEHQTYPHRELIISYPASDERSKRLLQFLTRNSSKTLIKIERDKNESIGVARNHAIIQASGEYVCMWDDDDIYDPTRIFAQYTAIMTDKVMAEGSVFSQILLYHRFNQTSYLSFPSYWACSLLCKKSAIVKYPCLDLDQFEYAAIINFLTIHQLLRAIPSPSLYVSVFHGGNLIKYSTFLFLVNQSETVSSKVSENIKKYLEWKIHLPDTLDQ